MYVWNQWVFGHEILVHRRLPYFTNLIFSLSADDANLSLHNYTAFQNVLAMPLTPLLGVVATFNVVFLSMSVLTAYATFLLARHVTARSAESWLAGLLFAWSPVLVTRGMGHFSLVAAAPLAIFLLVLMKADGHERFRDAVALGAIVAWAASAEAYYGVYCLLIGGMFLVARVLAIESSPRSGRAAAAKWALNVMLFCVAGLVAAIAASGGGTLRVMGIAVSVRSLYTPMLVLTVLATIRALWRVRARLKPTANVDAWHLARLTVATGLVATLLLSPVLYAVGVRIANAEFDIDEPYWRSSPDGVDLVALVLPNPNHPLAPARIVEWLTSRPSGYIENVASVPIAVVDWAHRRLEKGMASVALVVHFHAGLWSACPRPLRSHRWCQYVHPGAVGLSALCTDPGTGALTDSLLDCDDVGRGCPVRDGARVDGPLLSPKATSVARRNRDNSVHRAATCPDDAPFSGGAEFLSRGCGSAW